jgi:hypothetical protein
MRDIKFEICIRHKATGNLWIEKLTLNELLDRNGSLYNPSIQEVVYKRQYTGETDKNGTELYEGDICKAERQSDLYEIIYYKGGFAIKYIDSKIEWTQHFCNGLSSKDLIRVGSIYENPELLTK